MENHKHVVCPHCGGVNRVLSQRLADAPVCGKCRQPLFSGKPTVLDDASFATQVERSGLPVVVDFWAPWCGPCNMMAPHFERAAAALEPNARLAKLNTDENPATATRFAIRSIPTLILFSNGREIDRRSGAMDSRALTDWIRSRL
ncbi:MAG: thioredoxin TrxC [Burkholderiales bacterium]